jgi:hypothetical protein
MKGLQPRSKSNTKAAQQVTFSLLLGTPGISSFRYERPLNNSCSRSAFGCFATLSDMSTGWSRRGQRARTIDKTHGISIFYVRVFAFAELTRRTDI